MSVWVDSNVPIYMSLDMTPESDMDDDEELAELTRRYFKSRGPATIQDSYGGLDS
ncbi:hypothetical protein [Methanobacterium subterraneum]|uniref:hypothetical protein n=1 Tax=Methanobacterium subterraneum TaxID=59277 RepID=UPI00130010A0|nr:hypothetical protein [Methanobacterium subterraneum]